MRNLVAMTLVAFVGIAAGVALSPATGLAAGALALSVFIAFRVGFAHSAAEDAPVASPVVAEAEGRAAMALVTDTDPLVEEDTEAANEHATPPLGAEPPESETPVAPATADVRVPQRLDCTSVLHALLDSSRVAGPAGAAHLWLEDTATATLRLVSAAGPHLPSHDPVPAGSGVLGAALAEGGAVIDAVSRFQGAQRETTLWRYAIPLSTGEARGVAAVDFASERGPDLDVLNRISAVLRASLAGCLALHLARQQMQTAEVLLEMARELSRLLEPVEVVQSALAKAMVLSEAVTGSVMLLDEGSGTMRIAAARGLPRDVVKHTCVREGDGIAGWVLTSGKPLLVEDLQGRGGYARRHGVRSAVSVPIADEDGILGVLNVGSRTFPARFSHSHMNALEILARQTAAALRNARAVSSARELYFATLKALALALETKDPYSTGGTERVLRYATDIGRRMGLDLEEAQSLEIAALLHDIGMAAAGEALAVGDRPLSTVERGLLKMHPVLAAEILEQAPALRGVIPIVYHHHEWFDGRGYVGGLAGEAIPLGARILAVADAFVAMTSPRPYRRAMSSRDALEELRANSGSQFDPEVVAVFTDLAADGERVA